MDGVIYRGNSLTPGVKEFFNFLRSKGIKFGLITNNAQRTARQYVEKLKSLGITVEEERILPAGEATARYLAQTAPRDSRVFVIGEDGLVEPLRQAGFVLTDEQPDYVVVGLDTSFTYEKLATACRAIRRGARFVASNTDATMPVEDALMPGAGSLVAAVETCSGAKPLVVGKPETAMLEMAMARMGVKAGEAAIVGDRLETDVVGGKRAGLTTILVLTGVASRDQVEQSDVKPDYVFENLIELRLALEKALKS